MEEINIEKLREHYSITIDEFNENVEKIFNQLSIDVKKVNQPMFVLIGGRAGAGKTDLVSKKYKELEGNAIIIDQDELRTTYPKNYSEITSRYDDGVEYQILKPYITDMIKELVKRARNSGYNVILESAFQRISRFIEYTKEFKKSGYNTQLALMAVTDLEGYISMLYRYCYFLEKDGVCRRNTNIDLTNTNNRVYENIKQVAEMDIFDEIEICIRSSDKNNFPRRVYSMNESNKNSKIEEEYIKAQELSILNTLNTFDDKYQYIKDVLEKHAEKEKLGILEQLKERFLDLRDESR